MVEKTLSASEHTKQQLASALKVLMAERPMDKITISDLTAICKIRRQSFYYHFENIYDSSSLDVSKRGHLIAAAA